MIYYIYMNQSISQLCFQNIGRMRYANDTMFDITVNMSESQSH
jgi:hypothetical protein